MALTAPSLPVRVALCSASASLNSLPSTWPAIATSSRQLHTTVAARSLLGGKLFKGVVKRRRYDPEDLPEGGGRISLFDQSALPEDVQLPKPAAPVDRVGAAIADGVLSALLGACSSGAVAAASLYLAGAPAPAELLTATGSAVATVAWVLRDALADEGNRSYGKKLFKLEITNADGTLASPQACAVRNLPYLLFPLAVLHPLLNYAVDGLLFVDAAALLLTADARRSVDYALGTRVVECRPGREQRVADMHETAEIRELRGEISSMLEETGGASGAGAGGARSSAQPPLTAVAVPAVAASDLLSRPAADALRGALPLWYEDVQRNINLATIAVAEQEEASGRAGGSGSVRGALPPMQMPPIPPVLSGMFSEVRDPDASALEGAATSGSGSSGRGVSGRAAPVEAEEPEPQFAPSSSFAPPEKGAAGAGGGGGGRGAAGFTSSPYGALYANKPVKRK